MSWLGKETWRNARRPLSALYRILGWADAADAADSFYRRAAPFTEIGMKAAWEDVCADRRDGIRLRTALLSVMGHLTKADGLVTRDEIRFEARVIDELDGVLLQTTTPVPYHVHNNQEFFQGVTHQEWFRESNARLQRSFTQDLFREGRGRDFPIDEGLDQLGRCSSHVVTQFVAGLLCGLHAVYADGELHSQQRALLESICVRLCLPVGELERLEAVVRAKRHARDDEPSGHARDDEPSDALSPDDAYAILGVGENCSDADITKAYRRMMNRHHPDKLAVGKPSEETMRFANEMTRKIKAAHDQLKKVRRFAG